MQPQAPCTKQQGREARLRKDGVVRATFPYIAVTLVTLLAVALGWGPLMSRNTLILAHNLDTRHPVHLGMQAFADSVREKSGGRIQIKLYPNGQLGTEREVLEQLQIGAVAFTKVSSLSLESFAPLYGALNAPFIFADEDHAYRVLDGPVGERLKVCSLDKKFRGLTFYSSGARSFYAARAILDPSDLSGLKIRVMGSQTALRMTELLGGSPAPMPYGEVYTGLQQKVIDGAENNITALTVSRHGEVAKHYSADEHIIAPDVLLVSTEVWDHLSDADRRILEAAAEESKELQRQYWAEALEEHTRIATEELGVTIHQPRKERFLEAVRPLHEELKLKSGEMKTTLEEIAEQR